MEKVKRRLSSWIEAFEDFTSILSSPKIFRRWTAIGIVSAALERRVWIRTQGMDLFPNLYMVLVGPPGVGKSVALSQAERLLRSVQDFPMAPSNVSSASLIDALGDAKRTHIDIASKLYLEYNYIVAIASEFGSFLPAYEPSFMNLLTKVYDGEHIEDRKRTKSVSVRIEKPLLTLLGGTTPSYLNSFLPEGAWDQGFTSRTLFIYSSERSISDPFAAEGAHEQLEKIYVDLLHDLKLITGIFGRISFDESARHAITSWHLSGGPPVPEHGKLLHYIPRRTAHVLKLCTISAVARGSPVIERLDFELALGWLLEAETLMPEIFKSMGASSDSSIMEDTWHYIWQKWMKDKKPVPERHLIHFISARAPSFAVPRILEVMVKSGFLETQGFGPDGRPTYKPAPKPVRQ